MRFRRRRFRRFRPRAWQTTFLLLLAAAIYSLSSREGREGGALPPADERPFPGREDGSRAHAHVERVVDGDTAKLADGREVRYLGLDAAEAGEPWAEEARRENEALVEGKPVELRLAGKSPADRYGRLLAVVYVAEGEPGSDAASVNQILLSRGLTWVYLVEPDSVPEPFLAAFLTAQGGAISARRGVWRDRLQDAPQDPEPLVSTRLRLHRRSCAEVRSITTRPVRSLEEEFRRGKSPCRKCRPLNG